MSCIDSVFVSGYFWLLYFKVCKRDLYGCILLQQNLLSTSPKRLTAKFFFAEKRADFEFHERSFLNMEATMQHTLCAPH